MKKASPAPRRTAAILLHWRQRVDSLAADHLILEIAADRAGRGEHGGVGFDQGGVERIAALEIDRQRQLDRLDDPRRIGEREGDRHLFAVGPAVG